METEWLKKSLKLTIRPFRCASPLFPKMMQNRILRRLRSYEKAIWASSFCRNNSIRLHHEWCAWEGHLHLLSDQDEGYRTKFKGSRVLERFCFILSHCPSKQQLSQCALVGSESTMGFLHGTNLDRDKSLNPWWYGFKAMIRNIFTSNSLRQYNTRTVHFSSTALQQCTAAAQRCNGTLQQHSAATVHYSSTALQQYTTAAQRCNSALQHSAATVHYNSTALQRCTTTVHYESTNCNISLGQYSTTTLHYKTTVQQ